MHTTPASLLYRLRQTPDQATWSRFVRLYTPLLFYWACKSGLRQEEAQDLIQDVFVLLIQKLPRLEYDPSKSFRAWLQTVTANCLRNRRQARAHRPLGSGDPTLDEVVDPGNLCELEEAEYRQHLVCRALQILKADFQPKTWQAFWEHVVEGRPAAEVAAEIGLTAGAIYTARVRILDRLRQELAGLLD